MYTTSGWYLRVLNQVLKTHDRFSPIISHANHVICGNRIFLKLKLLHSLLASTRNQVLTVAAILLVTMSFVVVML